MRTDFDLLPASKHRDLERLVEIRLEEFEEARALSTQRWKASLADGAAITFINTRI